MNATAILRANTRYDGSPLGSKAEVTSHAALDSWGGFNNLDAWIAPHVDGLLLRIFLSRTDALGGARPRSHLVSLSPLLRGECAAQKLDLRGKLLWEYRVVRFVGDGASSRIWVVRDQKTRTIYALKHVISEGEKEDRFLEQVRQEWEIGSKLSHPAIRSMVKLCRDTLLNRNAKELGLVMEYVDAEDLATIPKPPLAECLTIFRQVASALVHMHERGFVHADMKPLNILYDETKHVKLIDLGQACKVGTVKERVQGSPGFLAPEQAERGPVTEQTDVFNFGATMFWVLFRMYASQAAKTTESTKSRVDASLVAGAGAPIKLDATIPQALSDLLLDCLEEEAHKRKRMTYVLRQLTGMAAETPAGVLRARD